MDPISYKKLKKLSSDLSDIVTNGVYGYNLHAGLRKWRSKVAAMQVSTNKVLNIQFLGDSITEGAGSDVTKSNWLSKSYVGRIRQRFTELFGDVGSGFLPNYYPTGSPFWTYNSGFVSNESYGPNGTSRLATASGATAQITFNGTGFVLVCTKYSGGGTFNVSIDGGANTQYSTNAGVFSSAFIQVASGLTDGDHTLLITTNQSSGNVYLGGGYAIKGTKGIRCNMCGQFGIVANKTSAYNDSKNANIKIWNPDLVVISFTANDYTAQTDLAAYKNSIQALIDAALSVGSEVLLTTIGLRTESMTIPQVKYIQTIRDLARSNNIALLDISDRWVTADLANTLGYLSDTVHPTAAGHQDIANAFLKILI